MKRINVMLSILLIISTTMIGYNKKARNFITIGTGGVTGVYYPTGGAISKIINKKFDTYNLKMTVESTGGSVYNINAVLSGDLDFGIAQSDRQYQAVNGLKEWEKTGKQANLRSVFSIYPESITFVASAKSGIKGIKDMKGKRLNLGNPGSGNLGNALDVLKAAGLTERDIKAEYVKAAEAPSLLQDGRIDGFFYTVGHPNGNIKESTAGRIKVRIVDIKGPGIDALIAKLPFYAKSVIPKKLYEMAVNTRDAQSVGVKATLITSAKVPDTVVYAITKEVFENFEDFKALHPAYQVITKKSMLKGLSAPVHPGALKYYKEAGLDKHIDPKLIK